MENLDNIDNKKGISRVYQVLEGFSDKIGKRFGKKPDALGKRRLDKCEKCNRVKVKKDKKGNQYLKITIHPLDRSDGKTERAEIQAKRNLEYDKKYEQSFSFQLPKDFLLDNPRLVIGQWKRKPAITDDDAPLLAQRIRKREDGKYYLVFTDGYRKEIGNFIPIEEVLGKRVKMKYEVKFSDDKESYVVITANYGGNEIEIYNGPLNIPHPEGENSSTPQAYYKFGIYRDIEEKNQKTSILFKKYKIRESDT